MTTVSLWKLCGCGCGGYNLALHPHYYWTIRTGDYYTIYSGHSGTGAFVGLRPDLDEAELAAKEHAAKKAA